MRCRVVLAVVCAAWVGGFHAAFSQTPAAPAPEVPTLVRTKNGQLVHTLNAGDFVLTDDGVPQKLTLEEDTGGEPLALVVAIEIGGAGAREFDKMGALAPMIESVVGAVPYKIAVVAFDSHATLEREFTPNAEAAA